MFCDVSHIPKLTMNPTLTLLVILLLATDTPFCRDTIQHTISQRLLSCLHTIMSAWAKLSVSTHYNISMGKTVSVYTL